MTRAPVYTKVGIALLVWIACTRGEAWGQDSHQWNLRYGTEAELLAGAVIGSPVGLANTFYNPGALALVRDPKQFTTALSGEYSQLTVKPDVGDREGLKWS